MMRLAAVSTLVLALAACGSGSKPGGGGSPSGATTTASASASPTATPSPSTASRPLSATSGDPQVVAVSLKAQIPQIGKIVKITENNDGNNLIGRPGQYDAATFMQDTRLQCSAADTYKEPSIACGAKVERWSSNGDAKARAADIQKKLKALGLGAEYDYVRDRLVLRVSSDLKPSQAKKYETAFVS